jgi:hypothetical protein
MNQSLIIESLFRVDESVVLYPDTKSELEAVRDRRKGISLLSVANFEERDCREYIEFATKLGLVTETRCIEDSVNGITHHLAFSFHHDQAWRVDAIVMSYEYNPYHWCDSAEYMNSLLLGYSREEAHRWIESHRHHHASWGPTLFFLISPTQRAELERIRGGSFLVTEPSAATMFYPIRHDIALRRDALDRVPATTSIARIAVADGTVRRLFSGVGPTGNFLVRTCDTESVSLIQRSQRSRVQFWLGTRWGLFETEDQHE